MTDTPGLSFSLKEKYRNRVIVWKKFYNLPTISRRKKKKKKTMIDVFAIIFEAAVRRCQVFVDADNRTTTDGRRR